MAYKFRLSDTFDLVDDSTIKELTKNLNKKVNLAKDYVWNNKMIYSQLMQGISAGESIGNLATRMINVESINMNAAIRNARTMTTAAESKGRQASYEKAVDDGIVMQKVWIATPDDRVRDWHLELDGKAVDVDDVWTNDYGDIEYPGDPSADGANVFNCRCTMKTKIIGFKGLNGKISYVKGMEDE